MTYGCVRQASYYGKGLIFQSHQAFFTYRKQTVREVMLATNGEYHLANTPKLSIGFPLRKAATQIAKAVF